MTWRGPTGRSHRSSSRSGPALAVRGTVTVSFLGQRRRRPAGFHLPPWPSACSASMRWLPSGVNCILTDPHTLRLRRLSFCVVRSCSSKRRPRSPQMALYFPIFWKNSYDISNNPYFRKNRSVETGTPHGKATLSLFQPVHLPRSCNTPFGNQDIFIFHRFLCT